MTVEVQFKTGETLEFRVDDPAPVTSDWLRDMMRLVRGRDPLPDPLRQRTLQTIHNGQFTLHTSGLDIRIPQPFNSSTLQPFNAAKPEA